MKKILKMAPFFVILVALFLFQNVFPMYLNRQLLISMESNQLLTNHHLQVDDDLLINLENCLDNIIHWRYRVLDEHEGVRILAFYTSEYSNTILPLLSGRMFDYYNSNQAIVGLGIDIIEFDGKDWIEFGEVYYEVIGRIGIIPNSPVQNYILINDSTLFHSINGGVTYIDSLYGRELDIIREEHNLLRNNFGVERWFQISVFKTVVELTGVVLMASTSIVSGIILFDIRRGVNELKNQIGVPIIKLISSEVLIIGAIHLVHLILINIYHQNMRTHHVLRQIVGYNLLSFGIIIFIYFTITVSRLRRRKK